MSLDCLDELAVQRSFVFLSENLNFESLQDELNQRNLISEKETKDYIFNAPGKHFRGGKFIKLMIKKRRCKDFVACLHETSNHGHICKKILEVKANQQAVKNGAVGRIPAFTVTDELLQRHFEMLYTYLEPRKIADEMFQVDCISVSDHDIVTDSPKKYKRLRSLLEILKMRTLHGPFLFTLECLHCNIVVNTLKTDKQCIILPFKAKYAMWIQHNFTILQEELPATDCATVIMKQVLDISNISDIESCNGAFRQKSKLLKILLMKGQHACKKLISAIKYILNREDLVLNMESKSESVINRGKPVLTPSLTFLTTHCLQEHEDVLYKELEPIAMCDYLFEEGALNILDHDIITETKHRQKQIKRLIEKLTENTDCFHFFLYILQKEEFETIRKKIRNPPLEAEEESNRTLKWKLSHSVVEVQDDVNNEPIEMRLTVYGRIGEQVEQVLYKRMRSSDTEILGEALSHGQMDIDDVSAGSVVIRLRPVTDQAVQTLISAKDNNKLLQMIFGILRKVNIAKIMSDTKSLQIRIQVFYDMLATSKQDTEISKVADVEKRVKVHRNVLFSVLDPMVLIPALSKSKSFPESVIDSLYKAPSCYERVNVISSFVENGSPDVANEFIAVLKDLGHSDIVELLDPSVLHSKAEKIRKKITSNYENILNEMQMTLAKETLSKCIGNTDMIKEKISPRCGNRKQRMSDFLRFILQDDHNVLEFEEMLKRNGLYELLLSEENVQEDHISNQDIEVTVVKDTFPTISEGSLLDSVITLSYTEGEGVKDNFQLSSEEQIFDSTVAWPNDDEMQLQSAKKTLLKCTEEFEEMKTILSASDTHRQRMDDFLQFSQDKENSIKFERILKNSGLKTDSLDELAVRRLFVFLKKTLNFDYYQDEFIQRNLLSGREVKEYILTVHEYFRSEKFLKLIIKKKRCKEFVACMLELPNHDHDHITEKIRNFIENGTQKSTEGSKEKTPPFSVSDELLKKHFHLLYTVLEPRAIADEMFQAGQISCNDHDDITDDPKKYKRMRNLLDVLKRKQLYAPFLRLLESLHYASLLETLSTDRQPWPLINSSECTVRIQRSFTTLQIELPDAVLVMMEHVLTESDVSDIQRCSSTIRQISKLIKILVSKGQNSCKEFSGTIEFDLKREYLIKKMIKKSDDVVRRGKPDLKSKLRCLTTACLKKYEDFFYDELEPVDICDVLFEESAVDIPSHDKITESTLRRKQIEYLLKTVKENKHDCFHFFLYTIQEILPFVCQELEKRTPSIIEVDGVPNELIQLKLTTKYKSGAREDQILYQRIHSFDTGILKEVITRQTGIESVTSIAVVLQIRPLTGSAVPTPLNDNDRQKLMRNVSKMVEEAETCIPKVMNKPNPLQIRIQIQNYSWESPKSDGMISNETQIKNRIKVHRNVLASELDPGILLSALSPCKSFTQNVLDALPIGSCERVEAILAFVENGSDDVVNELVRALHDLSFDGMVELIDPSIAKSKAENIKRRILSNYKDVLDEMQLSLAREALLKCTGDVDAIRKKIRPTNGSRRQRMSEFLHFVLQDDINLIEFERMLKRNNLENIIDTWADDLDSQELKRLLESFDVVIPSYSIARALLEGQLLTECVKEVRALGKSVVLCKNLKDKKPGTVCVYEVLVKNDNNHVVIYEKDPENRSAFFNETQRNLVKVILIDGMLLDVSETKDKVYQKYKQYIDSGRFRLQHVSEKYVEVAKLSAHQKIVFFKEHVESVRRSFPLHAIEGIVHEAASRALTYENIRNVCRQAYINGIGNVNSDSYTTRSIFTLNRITVELKDKTKESITEHLRDEICSEIRNHIRLEPESKLRLDLILKAINLASTIVLASMLIVMISIVNPLAGVIAVTATGFVTLLIGKDVNSETWRDTIAREIYNEVSNRQNAIENELSSLLRQKFNVASDELNAIAKKLDDFRRRIDSIV